MVVSPNTDTHQSENGDDHSRDIYTLANVITLLRLMLVPFFFVVLVEGGNDVVSFALFATAALTDWVDGQIARRTGTVTEIGKAIDPLVDRLLIASAVLGLYIVDRLPGWMVLLLVARDAYLLAGAYVLAKNHSPQLPVVYLGKVTTALLLTGFASLVLNQPQVPGLGVATSAALPGLTAEPVALGIWLVYAGILTSLITMMIYTVQARAALRTVAGNAT